MLSSVHNDETKTKVQRTRWVEGGQEEVRQPVMVEQYNNYMGGVDKRTSSYPITVFATALSSGGGRASSTC